MAATSIKRYIRPLDMVVENMAERARHRRNPFDFTEPAEAEGILHGLTSLDRDAWADAFFAVGKRYEEQARAAEAAGGDPATIQQLYQRAYGYYRVGRYPAPN